MAGKEKDKDKEKKLEFTRKPCPNEFENRVADAAKLPNEMDNPATFPDPKAQEPREMKKERVRGFPCRYCGEKTEVRQTWDVRNSIGEIHRRRFCPNGHTFLTREIAVGKGAGLSPEGEEF